MAKEISTHTPTCYRSITDLSLEPVSVSLGLCKPHRMIKGKNASQHFSKDLYALIRHDQRDGIPGAHSINLEDGAFCRSVVELFHFNGSAVYRTNCTNSDFGNLNSLSQQWCCNVVRELCHNNTAINATLTPNKELYSVRTSIHSVTPVPVPSATPTNFKACTVLLEEVSKNKPIKIFDSSSSARPLLRKMISAEFDGKTALVASTFAQEVYIIWNPLSFSDIDLSGVKNNSIPGVTLTCSSFPEGAEFGGSLAQFNGSLVIGAPNATVSNVSSGIVFGVQSPYMLPNATVDICGDIFRQYTWNITNSTGGAYNRLGYVLTHGTMYDRESLVIAEGSLPIHNKTIYVVQSLTQSCDVVSMTKTSDYCSGFRGKVSNNRNSTQFSDIKIAVLASDNSTNAVIFIGCPSCKDPATGSIGTIFSWNVVPDQKLSETIGAEGTIVHSGLNETALFGSSISINGNNIFIGVPQAYGQGFLYDYVISTSGFRGTPDLSSASSLVTIHPSAANGLFGASVQIGALTGSTALVIGSPAFNNNIGKVDVLLNPHFQGNNVTVSASNVSFADLYIQIKSSTADMSMLGEGVVEFLNFTGQSTLALAGANATDGWIFSKLSCD